MSKKHQKSQTKPPHVKSLHNAPSHAKSSYIKPSHAGKVQSRKKPLELKKAPKNQDRYDPWRVEGAKESKWESLILIVLLLAMFVGAYMAGWTLGGMLRQRIERRGEAEQSEQSDEIETHEPEESEAENANREENSPEAGSETKVAENPNQPSEAEKTQAIASPDITGKRLIALTFDDGPSGAVTDQLLSHLRDKQVRATFFVLGYMAERTPSQLQREVSEGHEVGSHSANHTAFSRMTGADLANDTVRMNQIFMNILGHNTPFMRPPYGDGAYTEKAKVNIGQPMILWTVDTLDWKYRDAQTVRQNAVKDAFDGAIILFHDVYQSTADAIPLIIDDLRAQGYEFLTVSELAKARGVTLQNGVVYGSFTPR